MVEFKPPSCCVISCALLWVLTITLGGCGGGGSVTTTTTTTTPTPTPPPSTPAPPTPAPPLPTPAPPLPPTPPGSCTTADCCKSKVTLKADLDGQICDDFYASGSGVAISMLTTNTWAGSGPGGTGMDAGFFASDPPATIIEKAAQAMTILGSSKPTWPYPGVGEYAGKWGVVLSIGPSGNFWKFFTYCPQDAILCAQCTDGFVCPIHASPDTARLVLPANWTYEQFKANKDRVFAQTGTPDCKKQSYKHQYNEFDTNGLSENDLGGIFIAHSGGAASQHHAPQVRDVCKFMAKANKNRVKPWPVYQYDAYHDQSSLEITGYLDCSSEEAGTFI